MQPSGYPGGPLPGLSDFFSVELLNPQTGHVSERCRRDEAAARPCLCRRWWHSVRHPPNTAVLTLSLPSLLPPPYQALPSIDYDGSRVFVGEPGQEFTVAVSMSNYTGSDYKISLRVDGNDPGYSLVYYGTNRAYKSVFQGWLHQSGAHALYLPCCAVAGRHGRDATTRLAAQQSCSVAWRLPAGRRL
jgi:hypothetical protein